MPSGALSSLGADAFPLAPQSFLDADARAGIAANGKASYTIDQAATQLLRDDQGWSAMGQPFTVTYAYRASAPASMPSDTGGFQAFNPAQITQAELALKSWSDVANIHFVRIGAGTVGAAAYSDSATILLGDYTTGEAGSSAFTFFPGSTSYSSSSGDVWINSTLGYNANPVAGNYGGMTLVHEIGHAIGLEHPSDYDASANSTLSYATDASYYEDDRQYTVMSYFSETNTGANFGGTYAASPLLDDIAAAQKAYGPNMATRLGDTVYGFHSNADEPWFIANSSSTKLVFAVWDAGGTDTFDFSGYGANQLIDLRPGNFSNVGGLAGNVAIAQNVTIEGAIGGSGADVIYGNSAGDTINGGAGNDSIVGGSGARNQLSGGDGNDSIAGGAGFDAVNGNKGDDTIDGGSGGSDWLLGGQGNDLITAHTGANILNGNLGSDTVAGGAGDDIVRGGQGSDLLTGGAGNDHLFGDLGDDTLTGGTGADTFHFAPGGGQDLVTDFNLAEGDRIELDGVANFAVTQGAGGAVIAVGADAITLANVQVASLPAGSIFLA